jgi:hypothetical protein
VSSPPLFQQPYRSRIDDLSRSRISIFFDVESINPSRLRIKMCNHSCDGLCFKSPVFEGSCVSGRPHRGESSSYDISIASLCIFSAKSSRIRARKARVRTLRDSNSIELWDQFQHQNCCGPHRARHKTTARNGLGSSQGMNDMRGSRRRTHLVHALMSQEVV